MATITLIVVIIVLTCNMAILYLPFDKKKKAILSLGVVGIMVVGGLAHNAQTESVPVILEERIANIPDPVAQQAVMARFNVSVRELNKTTAIQTPIELSVAFVLIFALVFTPILINVAKNNDDVTAMKVHLLAFSLSAVACALLLSLQFGLELTLLPWYKKTLKEERPSPALT